MKEVLVYINPGDGVYFEVFKNMHAAVVKHRLDHQRRQWYLDR